MWIWTAQSLPSFQYESTVKRFMGSVTMSNRGSNSAINRAVARNIWAAVYLLLAMNLYNFHGLLYLFYIFLYCIYGLFYDAISIDAKPYNVKWPHDSEQEAGDIAKAIRCGLYWVTLLAFTWTNWTRAGLRGPNMKHNHDTLDPETQSHTCTPRRYPLVSDFSLSIHSLLFN
jgi:hypothetical protein